MSSDTDSETEKWVPYSARPEWSDVTPIPQNNSDEPPVCRIAYTDKFKDVMGYFRAILVAREHSLRALELAGDAVNCNMANYTAWHYRREVLESMKAGPEMWEKELEFAQDIAERCPKNYQLWYHREVALSHTGHIEGELEFTGMMLEEDSKNYHAWTHRQWALQHMEQAERWAKELEFVEKLLDRDVRNNSAWNERFFVVREGGQAKGLISKEVADREIEYAIGKMRQSPNNESPWIYARGIVENSVYETLAKATQLRAVCEEFCKKFPACAHCRSLLAEIADEERNEELRVKLLTELRDSVDTLRKKYWDWCIKNPLYK